MIKGVSPSQWDVRELPSFHILMVLIACSLLYVSTAGGHFSSTDEEDLYLNTALLARRSLHWLSYENDGYSDQTPVQRAPQEIGQSLVALPWYWAGETLAEWFHPQWRAYIRRAVMTTFNLVVTLITIWLLYLWIRQLTNPSAAALTAALYGLGTLAWLYSQTFYREPLVALCLLIAFWYASRFSNSLRRADFLIASAAIILAIATKFIAIIVIPWWIVRLVDWRLLRRAHLVALLSLTVVGATFFAVFSLPAKQEVLLQYFQEIRFDIRQNGSWFLQYGLYGLTLSTGKGLLIYAPPVLLSLLGFPKFLSLHRREALVVAGVFLTFLSIYSTRRGWHGGACWGPRYLLPVLPLLMLPVGTFIATYMGREPGGRQLPPRLAQMGILGICATGIVVQLAAVSIFPLNYYALKAQAGTLSPRSLDGGPTYLQEIYFVPAHTPIVGHAALVVQRIQELVQHGDKERVGVFPANAYDLWLYMIALDRLDYWWLHWLLHPALSVTPDPRLGVVTAPSDHEWLLMARNGGMQWNRWQLNWRDVEPEPGVYDFTTTDRELAILEAAGLEVTALLTYPPDWARRPGTLVPINLESAGDPEPSEWFRFVYAVVKRYPQIQYWEIWNEPDLEIFWGGTVEDYYKLLRSGYRAVKQANPDAQVLMSGLAYWTEPDFFEELLDLIEADPEASQYNNFFDITAWHWYARSDDLHDKVLWTRHVLAQRGMEKPIWINETNVALTPTGVQRYEDIQWTASAQEQAAFIVQGYANAMAAGAEKVFVFRLNDADMGTQWGMIRNDKEPRPAYTALQAVTEFLSGTTAHSRTTDNGITRVIFEDADGRERWVIWNQQPVEQQIIVPTVSQTLHIGFPDRRIQVVEVRDGIVTINLPPATANLGNHDQDYIIGGMPLFLFFGAESGQPE